MQIKLAGYNVETEILENLASAAGENEPLTPETFSSAYARISRSAKDVTALRKQARQDVHKARKSNQKIIFGMGHHSVAEHAVFNFDVIDVSRLALEEIEKFRLASYTEKSQRYVTLNGDFVLPEELKNHPSSVELFKETIRVQNDFYFKALEVLKEYLFEKHPDLVQKKSDRKVVEGWAKEDARYILSLATEGQVGLTINARNLEHLFRRFALSHRQEVHRIGEIIYKQVEKIAPSLILFPEPSAFERSLTDDGFKTTVLSNTPGPNVSPGPESRKDDPYAVKIADYTEMADERVLAAFLSFHRGLDYTTALDMAAAMEESVKQEIYKSLFSSLEFFDAPPREFELPYITFQATVCASNFAQLKRHRMATLVAGDYDTDYGVMVPENISKNGLEKDFLEIIDQTDTAYAKLKENHGRAADYILTNAHCRRVIMTMNLREMYHFVRLRADEHAQWDIRNLAREVAVKVRELMPLSTMLLCGKSDFVNQFERIYGKKPAFKI